MMLAVIVLVVAGGAFAYLHSKAKSGENVGAGHASPSATSSEEISSQENDTASVPRTDASTTEPVSLPPTQTFVALDPLPTQELSDGRLLRFKITAGPSAPLAVTQFNISIINPSVATGHAALYTYYDPLYSELVPLNGYLTEGFPVSKADDGVWMTNQPVTIPAGRTYYFELRDTVKEGGLTSAPSLTTSLTSINSSLITNGIIQTRTNSITTNTPAFTISVSPDFGSAPLRVVATYNVGSACSPYRIDWGDSSIDTYGGATSTECTKPSATIQSAHEYQAQGTYLATVSRGEKTKDAVVYVSSGPPIVFTFINPKRDAEYTAGETVPITWGASVPGNFNTDAYQVDFGFIPLGASDNLQYVFAAPWTSLTAGSATWVVPSGYSGTYQVEAIIIEHSSSGEQIIRKILSDTFTISPAH